MKKVRSIIALIAIASFLLPVVAVAADADTISPMASEYIRSYSAEITPQANGNLVIEFSIYGTALMDDIGATSIYLYEIDDDGESLAKTFHYTSHSNMMAEEKWSLSSSVSYSGTSGNSYYAIVYFRAAKGNSGDVRTYTTETVKAK